MIKSNRKPYGYRDLLAYQKAEVLQAVCAELSHLFPRYKTLIALADQMDRSARSVKQNIVEGWKRDSTKEYYEFLGFSIGANTELEGGCDDIWKGIYPELLKEKGIMGERGEMGNRGKEGEEAGGKREDKEKGEEIKDIEKLKFYPLDPQLPPIVQLKLRCKEINYLLDRLQKSLVKKMEEENTLSRNDKLLKREAERRDEKKAEKEWYDQFSLKRLENGQFVKDA